MKVSTTSPAKSFSSVWKSQWNAVLLWPKFWNKGQSFLQDLHLIFFCYYNKNIKVTEQMHMLCMCLLEIYAQTCHSLDLGTQSCRSLSSFGLLELATPTNILPEDSKTNHGIICIFKCIFKYWDQQFSERIQKDVKPSQNFQKIPETVSFHRNYFWKLFGLWHEWKYLLGINKLLK